jgi:hypothetical protein
VHRVGRRRTSIGDQGKEEVKDYQLDESKLPCSMRETRYITLLLRRQVLSSSCWEILADDNATEVRLVLTPVLAGNCIGAPNHSGEGVANGVQPTDKGGVTGELQS